MVVLLIQIVYKFYWIDQILQPNRRGCRLALESYFTLPMNKTHTIYMLALIMHTRLSVQLSRTFHILDMEPAHVPETIIPYGTPTPKRNQAPAPTQKHIETLSDSRFFSGQHRTNTHWEEVFCYNLDRLIFHPIGSRWGLPRQ